MLASIRSSTRKRSVDSTKKHEGLRVRTRLVNGSEPRHTRSDQPVDDFPPPLQSWASFFRELSRRAAPRNGLAPPAPLALRLMLSGCGRMPSRSATTPPPTSDGQAMTCDGAPSLAVPDSSLRKRAGTRRPACEEFDGVQSKLQSMSQTVGNSEVPSPSRNSKNLAVAIRRTRTEGRGEVRRTPGRG